VPGQRRRLDFETVLKGTILCLTSNENWSIWQVFGSFAATMTLHGSLARLLSFGLLRSLVLFSLGRLTDSAPWVCTIALDSRAQDVVLSAPRSGLRSVSVPEESSRGLLKVLKT